MRGLQHLNYCRQIAMQCEQMLASPNLTEEELRYFGATLALSLRSQKFILPSNGILLRDSELRALEGVECLRLPYKSIALEFPRENDGDFTKEVVFAWESGDDIFYQAVSYSKEHAQWGITDPSCINRKHFMNGLQDGVREIVMHPTVKRDDVWQVDATSASCVFDFLNALACSNVHVERSEPKNVGKKIKAALPFDTYHILTIDRPVSGGGGGVSTGSHRSPREHLRRGHIRRLSDGRRIWVNATVVAAGRGAGVVMKDYAVLHHGAKALNYQ